MSDTRTDAQRAADTALTAAIEQSVAAYEWETGLLTDYVVTVVTQQFDDQGDMHTQYGSLYRDNGLPHYRILGLLRVAALQAEKSFRQDEDIS